MSRALNQTGRSILYSCEWPLYEWAFKKVRELILISLCAISGLFYTVIYKIEIQIKSIYLHDDAVCLIKELLCASSRTTQPSVRHVTTGATTMTCPTRGAPSNPSWTGLLLIKTPSSPRLDLGAGMTLIWYWAPL